MAAPSPIRLMGPRRKTEQEILSGLFPDSILSWDPMQIPQIPTPPVQEAPGLLRPLAQAAGGAALQAPPAILPTGRNQRTPAFNPEESAAQWDRLRKELSAISAYKSPPFPDPSEFQALPSPVPAPSFPVPPVYSEAGDRADSENAVKASLFLPLLSQLFTGSSSYGYKAMPGVATGLSEGAKGRRESEFERAYKQWADTVNITDRDYTNRRQARQDQVEVIEDANDRKVESWKALSDSMRYMRDDERQRILGEMQLQEKQDQYRQTTDLKYEQEENKKKVAGLKSALSLLDKNRLTPEGLEKVAKAIEAFGGVEGMTASDYMQLSYAEQEKFEVAREAIRQRETASKRSEAVKKWVAGLTDKRTRALASRRFDIQEEANRIRRVHYDNLDKADAAYGMKPGEVSRTIGGYNSRIRQYRAEKRQLAKMAMPKYETDITGERVEVKPPQEVLDFVRGETQKVDDAIHMEEQMRDDFIRQAQQQGTGIGLPPPPATPTPGGPTTQPPARKAHTISSVPRDPGFSMSGLSGSAKNGLVSVVSVLSPYYNIKLNSGYRSSSPGPGGTSVSNTPHRSGNAVDIGLYGEDRNDAGFRSLLVDVLKIPGVRWAQYEQAGHRNANGSIASGPHIHVEFKSPAGPPNIPASRKEAAAPPPARTKTGQKSLSNMTSDEIWKELSGAR